MPTLLQGIVVGISVSVLVATAKALYSRRLLYLVQPKLFDYSGFGQGLESKTIEITAINSGKKTEEDVRVQFSPGFKYTVVASSASGLEINADGILRIDRLAPKQEVTIIIFAEGGEFRKDHVLGITSKETIGKIKPTLQEARNTPTQTTFAILFFFLFILPLGYAGGKIIEWDVWPYLNTSFVEESKILQFVESPPTTTASYEVKDAFKAAAASTVSLRSISRTGSKLLVEAGLINSTSERLEYTLQIASSVGEKRAEQHESFNYIVADIILYPGLSKTLTLSDYLPPSADPQRIYFEATIRAADKTVWVKRDIALGNQNDKH